MAQWGLFQIFNFVGSVLAIILTALKIKSMLENRADVKIEKFQTGDKVSYNDPAEILLRNTGKRPTTIEKIEVKEKGKLHNTKKKKPGGAEYNFDSVRLEENDTERLEVFGKEEIEVSEISSIIIKHSAGKETFRPIE